MSNKGTPRRLLPGRRAVVMVAALCVSAGAHLAWTAQESKAVDGAALYRTYCATCHGLSGRGDGPLAQHLRVPPTNLTRLAERHGGRFREDIVARVVDGRERIGTHGPSDMPVWGDAFSSPLVEGGDARLRARISALARYLASIQERPAP